jgi:hypothetical protein
MKQSLILIPTLLLIFLLTVSFSVSGTECPTGGCTTPPADCDNPPCDTLTECDNPPCEEEEEDLEKVRYNNLDELADLDDFLDGGGRIGVDLDGDGEVDDLNGDGVPDYYEGDITDGDGKPVDPNDGCPNGCFVSIDIDGDGEIDSEEQIGDWGDDNPAGDTNINADTDDTDVPSAYKEPDEPDEPEPPVVEDPGEPDVEEEEPEEEPEPEPEEPEDPYNPPPPPVCCFLPGTKITMADGTYQNIEEIQVGDAVRHYDIATGELKTTTVTWLAQPIKDTIVQFTFEDGSVTKHTYDHPFYVQDYGWCAFRPDLAYEAYGDVIGSICQVKVGHKVIDEKDGAVEIVDITVLDLEKQKTYTFGVDTDDEKQMNYFAEGKLVHNKIPCEDDDPPVPPANDDPDDDPDDDDGGDDGGSDPVDPCDYAVCGTCSRCVVIFGSAECVSDTKGSPGKVTVNCPSDKCVGDDWYNYPPSVRVDKVFDTSDCTWKAPSDPCSATVTPDAPRCVCPSLSCGSCETPDYSDCSCDSTFGARPSDETQSCSYRCDGTTKEEPDSSSIVTTTWQRDYNTCTWDEVTTYNSCFDSYTEIANSPDCDACSSDPCGACEDCSSTGPSSYVCTRQGGDTKSSETVTCPDDYWKKDIFFDYPETDVREYEYDFNSCTWEPVGDVCVPDVIGRCELNFTECTANDSKTYLETQPQNAWAAEDSTKSYRES